MKNLKIKRALILTLGGLLALGLVACQNSESLVGTASADNLASAKSKSGDSTRIDSLDCSSLVLTALAKHGADDSLPESHDSLKARGCEDHVKVRHDDDDDDDDDGKVDSLKIEVDDNHDRDHDDDHADREVHEKCEAKSDSTHSETDDTLKK